jgi:hypothetical protein
VYLQILFRRQDLTLWYLNILASSVVLIFFTRFECSLYLLHSFRVCFKIQENYNSGDLPNLDNTRKAGQTHPSNARTVKLHSKRAENIQNYTRNERKTFKTTLETSGKHSKLHSKRAEKIQNYTRNERKRFKTTLETSVFQAVYNACPSRFKEISIREEMTHNEFSLIEDVLEPVSLFMRYKLIFSTLLTSSLVNKCESFAVSGIRVLTSIIDS